QSSAGALDIEIGGLVAGSDYDRLAVSGPAALAGALNVTLLNGYLPNVGDRFQVQTFASHRGDFDSYNGLNLGNNLCLNPLYAGNDSALSLVTYPVLDPIPAQTVDEGCLLTFAAHAPPLRAVPALIFTL